MRTGIEIRANTLVSRANHTGCDHCKNLEPEYEAAAYELEKKGVILAKMNIDNKGNRAVGMCPGVCA